VNLLHAAGTFAGTSLVLRLCHAGHRCPACWGGKMVITRHEQQFCQVLVLAGHSLARSCKLVESALILQNV
jgi:hypothetical protein